MSLNDLGSRFEEKPARTTFNVALKFLAILAMLAVVVWVGKLVFYPAQQAGEIIEQTLDADNVIYNYEWFQRQYSDIKGMNPKIDNAAAALKGFEDSAGARSNWRFAEQQEWNRLNMILLGLKNERIRMITEYNSRAAMVNRNIFMSSELPDHIEIN